MARLLDDASTVGDDELIVECRGCDTVWVFEHGDEAAWEFEPSQHGHPAHEAEKPIRAERYLRGHEWVVDHESSVKRSIFNCRTDAERYAAGSDGVIGPRATDPWVREAEPGLPSIRGYSLDTDRLSGEERSDFSRRVARTFVDMSPHEVETVHLMGITPYIREQDPAAFERLVAETDIEYEDEWLADTVDASDTVVDAVLRLFTVGLIEVIFYDTEGREIFTRYDGHIMAFYLDHTLFDDLAERLSSEDRARIERSGWG